MCEHHKALMDAFTKGASSLTAQNKSTIEALLKNSCKDILRVLQSKPAFFESLKQEFGSKMAKKQSPKLVQLISKKKTERDILHFNKLPISILFLFLNVLLGLLNEVKEIMHEKLLTTPHEQKEKTEYLKELLIREKANNELIRKLKDELAQAIAEKDKEVNLQSNFVFFLNSIRFIINHSSFV